MLSNCSSIAAASINFEILETFFPPRFPALDIREWAAFFIVEKS